MEEEDTAPLSSKAVVISIVNCTEDSRVWGVVEDWNNEVGRQTIGGDHSNHALWHVMSEGRQRGPSSGLSQGLNGAAKLEATEDMLQIENLLQECD